MRRAKNKGRIPNSRSLLILIIAFLVAIAFGAWNQVHNSATTGGTPLHVGVEYTAEVTPNTQIMLPETTPETMLAEGARLFTICTACHGMDARGFPNLGKDLIASQFVGAKTDDELLAFIISGRPAWDSTNTTGLGMPTRGGNPAFTDADIMKIIAHVRSLRNQAREAENHALAVLEGATLFLFCSVCHGTDAHGLPGLGKDLVVSEFVGAKTEEELLAFITTGRPIGDAANTTGVEMPPRGGNPSFTDNDILKIIAYIRSLRGQSTP